MSKKSPVAAAILTARQLNLDLFDELIGLYQQTVAAIARVDSGDPVEDALIDARWAVTRAIAETLIAD